MRHTRRVHALLIFGAVACAGAPDGEGRSASEYLYLWTASADSSQPDFLAVLDVTEREDRYGSLVTTLPVPGLRNGPHHTEHEMPADRQLFANGFGSGQTFVFDLADPERPRLGAQFGDLGGLSHPHSFVRLPNGNVLASFQMQHVAGGIAPGGIAELTPSGELVRSGSANAPGMPPELRVYSAGTIPALDRIVSTTTDMDGDAPASQLQIWRLSDFALLHTIELPPGRNGDEHLFTAEPRLLADGRTMLVSTFNCGLYLLSGLDGDSPSGRLVASFPKRDGTYCAIPVVAGNFYLVTVPAWSAVVSLDVSDPAAPREVSRVSLGADDVPHWITLSSDRRRVAITGYRAMADRVVIARFDPESGRLSLDERFREVGATEPGFRMSGKTWPHGGDARGVPHGAVFGRP